MKRAVQFEQGRHDRAAFRIPTPDGEAPFDDARVDSSSFVRGLDAPEIVVSADGDALEASTQAVFDEYERVRRYGFSQAEVDRAVSSVRTS